MPESIGFARLQELLVEGALLVEVLPPEEYAEAHIPGAVNVPLKELGPDSVASLDRRRAIVVYCWDQL